MPSSSQPLKLGEVIFSTIDLTQDLSADTPMFESSEPAVKYERLSTVKDDGYESGAFHMAEHCGTHIDAPCHFIDGAESLDQIAPERLILPAVVIDMRSQCQRNQDYVLELEDVKAFEKHSQIPPGAAVLLLTGWSKFFANAQKYRNEDEFGKKHFPGFGLGAIQYLIDVRQVGALGIDTLSVDCGLSEDFAVHNYALSHNVLLIENLVNLEQLPPSGITVFLGAIKLRNATGGPLRVLALVPKS